MYTDKIVACIKVNGKILREDVDTVTLPFGCEYSILVKNLNSVRAQVTVAVDGADAAGQLVINPNSDIELQRFIRNGNLDAGNRFKFIERTKAIEDHRGIGTDDGLIRIEARRERVAPVYQPDYSWYPRQPPVRPRVYLGPRPQAQGRMGRSSMIGRTAPRTAAAAAPGRSPMRSKVAPPRPDLTARLNDTGITVPGSVSSQRFQTVSGFALEPGSVVIVLRLRGQIGTAKVEQPVTVDMKPECQTCGKANSANSQFCSRCGTAVYLVGS